MRRLLKYKITETPSFGRERQVQPETPCTSSQLPVKSLVHEHKRIAKQSHTSHLASIASRSCSNRCICRSLCSAWIDKSLTLYRASIQSAWSTSTDVCIMKIERYETHLASELFSLSLVFSNSTSRTSRRCVSDAFSCSLWRRFSSSDLFFCSAFSARSVACSACTRNNSTFYRRCRSA